MESYFQGIQQRYYDYYYYYASKRDRETEEKKAELTDVTSRLFETSRIYWPRLLCFCLSSKQCSVSAMVLTPLLVKSKGASTGIVTRWKDTFKWSSKRFLLSAMRISLRFWGIRTDIFIADKRKRLNDPDAKLDDNELDQRRFSEGTVIATWFHYAYCRQFDFRVYVMLPYQKSYDKYKYNKKPWHKMITNNYTGPN